MSTYSRPARRYSRILAKFFPKKPNPSRKRKMVMSARTTMAMRALLPKNALIRLSARHRRTGSGTAMGDVARTSTILQSCRGSNGDGKFGNVTIRLQARAGPALFRTEASASGHLASNGGVTQSAWRHHRCRLQRRGVWQNHANRGALAEGAFGFDPAAMELRDVFD